MRNLIFYLIIAFIVSCSSLNYHKEQILLHGETYEYRVYGDANTNDIRAAIEELKRELGSNEFIYSVWMETQVIKVHTVMGIPKYRNGNQGYTYTIKKVNGVWVPRKEEGTWIS